MNRKEYMEQLSRALEGIDTATAAEIMEDYEAHFERAKEAGRSEEEIIGELGSIDEFVQELGQFVQKEEHVEVKTDSTGEKAESVESVSTEETIEKITEVEKAETEATEVLEKNDTEEIPPQAEYRREYHWGQNRANQNESSWQQEQTAEDTSGQEEHAESQWDTKGARWKINYNGKDAEKYVKMAEELTQKTVKVVGEMVGQLSGQFDKAFGKFNNWFNSYEKSGESEADYQKRQENAKVHRETEGETGDVNVQDNIVENAENTGSYRFNGQEMAPEEHYQASCNGILREDEGIRNISIDARSANVNIYPSTDNQFRYEYKNEGSAGSKLVYHLDQRRTSDTMFLSVAKNEDVQRKNHFSILGGVFDDTSDLEVEIWVPEWMNSVTCNGKSGDFTAENAKVRILQLKSLSGDIELCGVHSAHCSVETSSGDVNVSKSGFEKLLAASKSGDVEGNYVQAQKADFRSMSGDVHLDYVDAEEVTAGTMSGDAEALNCKAEMLVVSSVSGDSTAECVDSRNMKVSSTSGEVIINKCQTQNSILSTVSGDMDVPSLSAERLSASATSGDISLRGSFNEMEVNNGSGDIIIVQQGDTRARINARSGDVDFHLKNENGGFIANLKTHGDIDFDYNGLHLSEAASGEHRYGAERSLLDFSLISGDIRITS